MSIIKIQKQTNVSHSINITSIFIFNKTLKKLNKYWNKHIKAKKLLK